jgi:hypothetical protein
LVDVRIVTPAARPHATQGSQEPEVPDLLKTTYRMVFTNLVFRPKQPVSLTAPL